jgi:hypothetical protein
VYFSPDHSCYMSPSDPHGLIALIIYIWWRVKIKHLLKV